MTHYDSTNDLTYTDEFVSITLNVCTVRVLTQARSEYVQHDSYALACEHFIALVRAQIDSYTH